MTKKESVFHVWLRNYKKPYVFFPCLLVFYILMDRMVIPNQLWDTNFWIVTAIGTTLHCTLMNYSRKAK